MKKRIFLIIGIILLLASVVIAVLIVKDSMLSKPKELKIEDVTNTTSAEKEQYVSPINFEKLNKDYPDIVAWVDIPGPEISYPVFCNDIDDTFNLYVEPTLTAISRLLKDNSKYEGVNALDVDDKKGFFGLNLKW